MSDAPPLDQVQARFSELVDRVEHTRDRITVTRNGRRAAVLMSTEELDSLEDTIELLSDPDAVAQLRASLTAHAAGDFRTGDELWDDYPKR